uniref:Receptor-recognising protein Gp38 domain-containing protein n=1 Tax=Ochrobactrum phage ORM_20 TaxID=2985243 RepID=A0A9N6WTL2_9VIRU|nr:hypothetical protein ORM20_00069 [Ochrobactrum phage ORM_20]
MTLPAVGPLKLSQIAAEYKKTQRPVLLSSFYGAGPGIPTSGAIKWSDFLGKTMEIRKTVNAGSYQNLNIQSLFTEAERQTNAPKIVTFISGAVCFSWDANYPALNTGNVGQNTLTLIINGGVEIQGAGGVGGRQGWNAGSIHGTKGGDAIHINHPGTTINNYGAIRGGGGGGGSGGQGGGGGGGYFDQRDYTEWRGNGDNRWRQKMYSPVIDKVDLYWDGRILNQWNGNYKAPYALQVGDWYYESGNRYGGDSSTNNWQIRASRINRYWTSGGRGGQWSGTWSLGGNGAGYGQGNQSGFAGEPGQPGGVNAGRGGNGGRGGDGGWWGTNGAGGANGNTGGSGNNGGGAGGSAGGAGGPAGFSIRSGVGAYTYTGGGTLNGPRS